MDLIADKKSLPPHGRRDLGALPAGSGAQLQDPFPRPRLQKRNGGHGAGLLNIVNAGLMPGMPAGLRLLFPFFIIKPVFFPGNRRQAKGRLLQKFLPVHFHGVYPQRLISLLSKRLQKFLIFSAQQQLHSFLKLFRDHSDVPFFMKNKGYSALIYSDSLP